MRATVRALFYTLTACALFILPLLYVGWVESVLP